MALESAKKAVLETKARLDKLKIREQPSTLL
jgi:hypothetical protein